MVSSSSGLRSGWYPRWSSVASLKRERLHQLRSLERVTEGLTRLGTKNAIGIGGCSILSMTQLVPRKTFFPSQSRYPGICK